MRPPRVRPRSQTSPVNGLSKLVYRFLAARHRQTSQALKFERRSGHFASTHTTAVMESYAANARPELKVGAGAFENPWATAPARVPSLLTARMPRCPAGCGNLGQVH
jgi:hypothetical protein